MDMPGQSPTRSGNNMSPNHYWNAVYLDTAWLYADLTWAAGFCEEDDEGRLTKYVKIYRNTTGCNH